MCARFYIDDDVWTAISDLALAQEDDAPELRRGDIRPSQQAPVLAGNRDSLWARTMAWGFPRYDGKGLVINARSESVTEKSMFRDSISRRRCVIPAKHFYEWDAAKNMVTFRRASEPVLFMAGIYDQFEGRNRFTVLTTAANESVSPYHDRMPVILNRDELEPWIWDDTAFPGLMQKKMPALEHWRENEQMSLF